MVSATNEQRQLPGEKSVSQKSDSEVALKPVRAADFLKNENHLHVSTDASAAKLHQHAHHDHHLLGGGSLEEEQRNSIAFKYVGAPGNNQAKSPQTKLRASGPAGVLPDGLSEEEALQAARKFSVEAKSVAANGMIVSPTDRAIAENSVSDLAKSAERLSGLNAKNDLSNAPAQTTEKLLALVGPDAITNLRERLREVWVDIDSTAASELDVIARMPVTTQGLSASEFLMVQSPQGIHFVAFLKNKNDFEVLQTFDRHALLPGNPTKQLVEAAIVSYEQLGIVFKAGAEHIGRAVQSHAATGDRNQIQEFMTQALRGRWIQAKRRSKKCGDIVEDLVEQIDELDSKSSDRTLDRPAKKIETEKIIKPENERPVLNNGDEG